jgi:hypothetical protein
MIINDLYAEYAKLNTALTFAYARGTDRARTINSLIVMKPGQEECFAGDKAFCMSLYIMHSQSQCYATN